MLTLELVTESSEFVEFPFFIYKNNPFWIPNIISEEKKSMQRLVNPFIDKNKVLFFIAKKDKEIVGRVSVGIDTFFGLEGKTAFFGHFEVINDFQIFKYMFVRIINFLKENNVNTLIGPINFSTNYSCGLLIDNFDKYPGILMPYNMSYYPSLFEKFGFLKLVDLYSFEVDDRVKMPEQFEKFSQRFPSDFVIKNINYEYLKHNVKGVTELFNKTWAQNLLFQSLSENETLFLIENFKHILNPAISFAVEYNSELIAFSISLPDYSRILKYLGGKMNIFKLIALTAKVKKIDKLRTAILGVSPHFRRKGIDVLLIMKTIEDGKKSGFRKAEVSWILETNKLLLNTIAKLQPSSRKVYRIYYIKIGCQ